jgi:endonuclease YncB( thermonuclease family)
MESVGPRRFGDVLVKKQDLIEWLVKNGDEAKAFDIEGSHVPQEIDTDTDRDLLAEYEIDVDALLRRG